jgi:hypothetical protein
VVDEAILEEKWYRAAPDTSDPNKPDYNGMLTGSKQKKDHSPMAKPAGNRPTWWDIRCSCLDTAEGEPALAVNVTITVPGHAYAATMRELRAQYGRRNVELAPTPAPKEPVRRRRTPRRKRV